MTSFYDFSAQRIDGQPQDLRDCAGQVVLVVNTASACGFTPQLQGLQALHQRFASQGLVVIGFPCNQFGRQEPLANSEIAGFCQRNYGVDFLMMAKVQVNGPQTHPLFAWLKTQAPGVLGTRAIKWNFTKFLIDHQGQVLRRYAPRTPPAALAGDIATALQSRSHTPAA